MDAQTKTLPAPDRERRFPLGNYDRKPQRNIDFSWDLHERDGARVTLELSCFHIAGRGYVASVNNELVEDGIMSCMPLSARRLAMEPAARYNKSKFEAFAAAALAKFTEVAQTDFADFLQGAHAPK
jgi:hypothetical protein